MEFIPTRVTKNLLKDTNLTGFALRMTVVITSKKVLTTKTCEVWLPVF